jgi:hypothetical protein
MIFDDDAVQVVKFVLECSGVEIAQSPLLCLAAYVLV